MFSHTKQDLEINKPKGKRKRARVNLKSEHTKKQKKEEINLCLNNQNHKICGENVEAMKVNVEIITGTFIDAEVSENATVKELKEKIATEVKLSVKRLILVVEDGKENRRVVKDDEDEMRLIDLGVKEDSHVYLFFKHPDLVYKEDRSQGRGNDASVEEVSSEEESKRGKKEEDEEVKGEEEDIAKKNCEEEEKNGEETKDDDNVEDGKDKAREGENEMDRVS